MMFDRVRALLMFALMVVAGAALAQTTAPTAETAVQALDLPAMVESIRQAVTEAFQQSSGALYLLLGVVGAFYFVWNRVRSLW